VARVPSNSWRAKLQTPLVTLLLLVFLGYNARSQPNGRGGGWTVIGHLVTRDRNYWEGSRRGLVYNLYPIAWVVRERGGLRLAPFTEDRTMADSEAVASLLFTHGRSGLWSVTRDGSSVTFDLGFNRERFTRDERKRLRTLAAAFVRTSEGGAWAWQAPLFEHGDTDDSRIVWAGWLNNLLVFVAIVAMVYSLSWVPRWVRAYLVWRAELERWKRLQRADRMRGKCVMCGYDTRGLPGPRCPECGSELGGALTVENSLPAARTARG
jgi:hypothetical protein